MSHSTQAQTSTTGTGVADRITGALSILLLLSIVAVAWRGSGPSERPTAAQPSAPRLDVCTGGRAGEPAGVLRGRLYGDLSLSIDSRPPQLRCGGGLRPDGRGIRLVLAPAEQQLVFVLGFPSMPDEGHVDEQAINLTIIDERSGRFYNSGTTERCWARLGRFRLGEPQGRRYELAGELYCAGALAAVNHSGFVTPGDFVFAGHFIAEPE